MSRSLLLACGLLMTLPALAAELDDYAFDFADGCSRYHFTARVRAPVDEVRRTILEPARIAGTNDGIRHSRLVSRAADGSFVRDILMQQCVIGICFDIRFIEKVREDQAGAIDVTQLPNTGSFRRGDARWTVQALAEGITQVSMQANQEPSFWVPPIIGPYLMRRTFEREVRETVQKIELVANAETVR